ncbi:MAG: pyridoxal-phosphate dependent enzyme [Acidimicrobiales bacterium]|nr:pyridoxal-phosphate dependent enzyme [Acidimicrobiales bacterium]
MTTDAPARTPLAHLPTPAVAADRLGAALGLPAGALWIKHDDLTGVAGGGNKVRKLEHLATAAVAAGADTLVTGGGRQSNHARLTAAVANRLGLAVTVVLASAPPDRPTGNVVLDEVLAPDIVWAGDLDYYGLEDAIAAESERLVGAGRRPYLIPVGGASAVGAHGYVHAADEIDTQVPDQPLVVVADGSGGTHAGLVAGFGDHARVLGVDVGTRPDLDEAVPAMAAETAALARRPVPTGAVQVDHDRIGPGYGAPSDACRAALDLAARCEGALLDPVYTGKGMAGLIAAVRDGRIDGSRPTVFLHTGGLPALFSPRYADWVRRRP